MKPFIPYGKQVIDQDDIDAVVAVLQSDWLTTGPAIEQFETSVCAYTGAFFGVAVCNGTAALHVALHALGITKGDEVIVPTMTFAATANSVLYCGGTPVFADVCADTLLIDPASVVSKITPRTKAIIGVDFAGHPCDWDTLQEIAKAHNLALVADACHAIGGEYKGRKIGTLADITVFSFHPVKHITTGEGGMCVTNNESLAQRMKIFRSHGITTDARQRELSGSWFYEMTELGYNYRITDMQCALGTSQLKKLPKWIEKRNDLAKLYDTTFAKTAITPLAHHNNVLHAYHLYVIKTPHRDGVFKKLRSANIGANVHYVPVHLHPYYRKTQRTQVGMCPVAEKAYAEILTLPLWVGMTEKEVQYICDILLT